MSEESKVDKSAVSAFYENGFLSVFGDNIKLFAKIVSYDLIIRHIKFRSPYTKQYISRMILQKHEEVRALGIDPKDCSHILSHYEDEHDNSQDDDDVVSSDTEKREEYEKAKKSK